MDILTKALPREIFQRHIRGLGMVGVKATLRRCLVVYDSSFLDGPIELINVYNPRGNGPRIST